MNTKTALSKLLRNVDICESACGKVAKASFWKQHKFPVGRVYEDLATCAGIINDADSIAFSPGKIYGQVYRVGSLSRKDKISNEQYSDWSYALNRSMNTIKNSKHYDELEDEIECFMMLNSVRLIRLFNDINKPDENSLSIRNEARDYVALHLRTIRKNALASRSLLLKSYMSSKAPWAYSVAFSAYRRVKLMRRKK